MEEEGTRRRRSRSSTRKRIGVERGKVGRERERERERENGNAATQQNPFSLFQLHPILVRPSPQTFLLPIPYTSQTTPSTPSHFEPTPHSPRFQSNPSKECSELPFFGRSPEAGERGGYSGSHFHFFEKPPSLEFHPLLQVRFVGETGKEEIYDASHWHAKNPDSASNCNILLRPRRKLFAIYGKYGSLWRDSSDCTLGYLVFLHRADTHCQNTSLCASHLQSQMEDKETKFEATNCLSLGLQQDGKKSFSSSSQYKLSIAQVYCSYETRAEEKLFSFVTNGVVRQSRRGPYPLPRPPPSSPPGRNNFIFPPPSSSYSFIPA